MGYTTEFDGQFDLNKPLTEGDAEFLIKLSDSRRVARNMGEEYGTQGEYFVDGGVNAELFKETVIEHNTPPSSQPSLYCHWVPTQDKSGIVWNGVEKFYQYTKWLQYLIDWLSPRGYVLNGSVDWFGENSHDRGTLIVTNNVLVSSVSY